MPERKGGAAYAVGDRVVVRPLSLKLRASLGEASSGTIEKVIPNGPEHWPLEGALYVRLDSTGEVLGCGPEAVLPSAGGEA